MIAMPDLHTKNQWSDSGDDRFDNYAKQFGRKTLLDQDETKIKRYAFKLCGLTNESSRISESIDTGSKPECPIPSAVSMSRTAQYENGNLNVYNHWKIWSAKRIFVQCIVLLGALEHRIFV